MDARIALIVSGALREAVCGISPGDIVAVLAMQATFMWIGDGSDSFAAVLLLADHRLMAVLSAIDEASNKVGYADSTVSMVETGDSWEELAAKLPEALVTSLTAPLSAACRRGDRGLKGLEIWWFRF